MKKTAVFLFPLAYVCAIVQAGGFDPQTPPLDPTPRPAAVTDPQPSPAKAVSDAATNASAAPTSQSADAHAAASATPVKRIVLEDKTLTNEEVKQLFALGYKPVGRNGEVYYCRRETETGSRVKSMTCKTADQMKQLTRESQDMLATKQRATGEPMKP